MSWPWASLTSQGVLESRRIARLSAATASILAIQRACVQTSRLASRADHFLVPLESPESMTQGLRQLLQKIKAQAAGQPAGEEVRAHVGWPGSR